MLSMVVRRHTRWNFSRKANTWTRCLATNEHFDAGWRTHPTGGGEFTVKSVTCSSWTSPQTPSIASQRISRPTISKLEFVMVPLGFWNKIMFTLMSSGHSQRKTIVVQSKLSPKITPPKQWPGASTIPMKSGQPHINLQHCVGC